MLKRSNDRVHSDRIINFTAGNEYNSNITSRGEPIEVMLAKVRKPFRVCLLFIFTLK